MVLEVNVRVTVTPLPDPMYVPVPQPPSYHFNSPPLLPALPPVAVRVMVDAPEHTVVGFTDALAGSVGVE